MFILIINGLQLISNIAFNSEKYKMHDPLLKIKACKKQQALRSKHFQTTVIISFSQAKLRKMVDEQVSVGARVEADSEPEPADPLITPATSALERSDLDPRPIPPERRLLIGTLDKRNGSLNGDKDGTLNRTTRLSIRNGKDNPFIGKPE